MADEEVVIRVVMEDAATGAGAGGTGGAPGSLTPRQIAKQAADIQVTLARGAAQAAVQMGLAQGKAQAQLNTAWMKAQAQGQAAFGKEYAKVSKMAADAAKAHANAAYAQARAAAAPALLAAKLGQERARAQNLQAKAAEGQKTWFDTILDVMDKLRGTLGGLFGGIVGGVLDLASAYRKARPKQQGQATYAQMDQAMAPLLAGQGAPPPPPGMEWTREPQAPTANQPFQPGQLAQKPRYQPGKEPVKEQQSGPRVFGPGGWKPTMAGIPGSPGVLAPGQPGTSPLAGMSGSGAAGGAIAAIKALVAFGYAIKDTTNVVVDSGSKFATSMISASEAPSKFIGDVSSSIRSFGDSMGVFGALISNVGALGQALGSVMGEVNQMGQRYGAVNPQIATAQAMADINQTLNDFRRGQEAAPDLVNFINQQSQLQQKFEEVKIRALHKIMPAVIGGMEIFEKKVLPLLEVIFEGLALIARAIGAGSREVRSGLADLELAGLRAPDPVNLPSRDVRDRNFRDVFTQRGREGVA